jgi:hypothetical protein
MSTGSEERGQPSEEELRAAYEAQIKQVRVEHVLLEHVVTAANLGLRRTGLAPGTEDERDPEQVRLAIESIRVLLPLLEASLPEQAAQLRDALSQLQFAFVKIGGVAQTGEAGMSEPAADRAPGGSAPPSGPAPPKPSEPEQSQGDEPGPAQRSGRLWVPGQ